MTVLVCICKTCKNTLYRGFGSVKFYQPNPDPLDKNPPKNTITFKYILGNKVRIYLTKQNLKNVLSLQISTAYLFL